MISSAAVKQAAALLQRNSCLQHQRRVAPPFLFDDCFTAHAGAIVETVKNPAGAA
jgi:hypothetical protein